jgi:tetratricopeptide (TPR) repeat protein
MIGQESSAAPFLGRDAELRELLAGLGEAEGGRGRLVLLGGEPGIGKSRLADELASHARERDHLVLWGRGWEDAGAPPYWPWVQLLRSYVRNADPAVVRRQMGPGASDIAHMLPELRDVFGDLVPRSDTESDAARFQLFDSTTAFLRRASIDRRLLVIIDDLQAADTPSISYLRFVASQLGEMPLLVLGTYRDVELTPLHPLTSAIAELEREPTTRTITLQGLGREALRTFIRASAGVDPDDRLVAAVARSTKGNPLYAGEAVRLLTAEGRLDELASAPFQHVAVPAGVRSVIGRRLARLDDATRGILSVGAVIGPEFGLELLRAVADPGSPDPLDLLDAAVREGLVSGVSGAAGRFHFSHDLVRETLYDELTPGQRLRLHQRIADGLEALYGASPESHLAELAYHFYEAEQGGPASERSVEYARRAGEQAARSLAFEEAARLYGIVLAALDRSDVSDPLIRLATLLALGDVQARGGDLAGSRTAFLEAAEIARRIGAAPELARAALGVGGRLPWLRAGWDTRLIPLLQDALVHLGGADDRLRVRLLTRLACAWRGTPEQRTQSDTLSRQAVELARSLGDPATLSYALAGRYWASWWPQNPTDRLVLAREMVGIAEASADAERLIEAQLMLWFSHTELADMTAARRDMEEFRRLVVELRQPTHSWLGIASRALTALLNGEFSEAERLIEHETDSGAGFAAERDNVSAARFHRFLLRREQGRLVEEESSIRASVDEFPWYPLHRSALACALVDLGRTEEARGVLGELARDQFAALYPDNEWLVGAALAAEASARLGDRAAAETLYAQLAPMAGRHAIGHAEGSVGAVDRYLGLLAASMERQEDAARHLEDAIEINERMGARPWAAHCRHDLAVVLRHADGPGDAARAAELDRAALVVATALGMPALASRIQSSARPDPATATTVTTAMFRREGEYWTVRFDGDAFRMRDAKGLRYLARLFQRPGQEIHALDLVTAGGTTPPSTSHLADFSGAVKADAGAMLDDDAKAAYRHRVDELRSELAQAEEWNDPERASAARAELDFLKAELASAVGLGGRDRRAASATERARISVTRAIRSALDRTRAQSSLLGRHLDATIRTGAYCSYTPDPRVPIQWEL